MMLLILLTLLSFGSNLESSIYQVCGMERIVSVFDTLPIRYSGIRYKISNKNDQIVFLIRGKIVSVSKSALIRSIKEDRECIQSTLNLESMKMDEMNEDEIVSLSKNEVSDRGIGFLLQYYISITALRDGVCIRSKENSRCSLLNSILIEQQEGGITATDPMPPRIHAFLCIKRVEDTECTLLAPWDFYRRGGVWVDGQFD